MVAPFFLCKVFMSEPINLLVNVIKLSERLCRHAIRGKLVLAGRENFTGRQVKGYDQAADDICILTKKPANALCQVQTYLNQDGLGLFIYDAYRPRMAVEDFIVWAQSPPHGQYELERKAIHYPDISKPELFAQGYVSDDSQHSYGNTVDLILIDLTTGNELDMGSRLDYMGPTSHIDATDINEVAQENRKILSDAMQKFGFEPYRYEWWHYSHKEREVSEPINIPITESLRNIGI